MKKRSIFTVSLVIVLSLCLSLSALAVVGPTDDFYVNDYSGVLTDVTKQMISDTNGYLEQNCDGAQIVVVTIEYLDTYKYADEYAVNLFNTWGVGNKDANNGMLLLLVTEEGKGWLTTGAGISEYFDESTVDMYLDRSFWFMFDNGEFDEAVSYVFKELVYWYEGHYGCDGGFDAYYNPDASYTDDPYYEDYPDYNRPTEQKTHWGLFAILGAILAFLFRNMWIVYILIIILLLINADRRRYRAYYMSIGRPIPRYHFWYMWGPRPHRTFVYRDNHRGPRPPMGGGPRPPRGGGGFGGGSHMGGGGFGGGGGFSGGGFGGGGHMGGGGFSGGGGGGRR